jgi:hypothetical protein
MWILLLSLLFISCGTEVVSTDVDNEISVSLSGNVDNGTLVAYTKVTLADSAGTTLDSTLTDSTGSFLFKNVQSYKRDYYILNVPSIQYRSIVPQDEMNKKVQIHSISEWSVQLWEKNNRPPFRPFIDSNFKNVFGNGILSQNILFDSNFVPFSYQQGGGIPGQGPGPKGPPSAQTMIIRQFQMLALLYQIPVVKLIDSLKGDKPFMQKTSFITSTCIQGSAFGQDSTQFQAKMGSWIAPNDPLHQGIPLKDAFSAGFKITQIPSLRMLGRQYKPFIVESLNSMSYHFLDLIEKTEVPPPNAPFPLELYPILAHSDSIPLQVSLQLGLLANAPTKIDRLFRIELEIGRLMAKIVLFATPESRRAHPEEVAKMTQHWMKQYVLPRIDLEDWINNGTESSMDVFYGLDSVQIRNELIQINNADAMSLIILK